jgi:4-amino-4-deoxy-L-arabinose transferase-like glycosyltransferase
LFYVALRRTVADRRLAAAFSLSLVLFFWFGWESHHSVSHSLALSAAARALGLGLGLVIGIGLMAKWSFLLAVLSLGVGLAFIPDTRIYTDLRSVSRLTQTQPRRWR